MSNNNSNQVPVQKAVDPRNTTVPTTGQKPAEKTKEEKDKEARRQRRETQVVKHPRSPIDFQHRDKRYQKDFSPVVITFIDGAYAGEDIELGLAVEEITQEQTAEWSNNAGKGIRAGANFNGISTRTFSVKLTFHDRKHDISHLVENLAHLHEIAAGATTPPTLLWKQGNLRANRVICTSFSPHYQHPLAGKQRGFRYCEVDLKFQLLGGKLSSDALAPPLTSTPLQTKARTTTVAEKEEKATLTALKELLNPCVTGKGGEQLVEMVKQGKQRNESDILALPHDAFVQAAVGGLFAKSVLAQPAIAEKLKRDLAQVLAEAEDGAGIRTRQLTEALISGNPSGLPEKLQEIFEQMESDYKLILESIQKQDISSNSETGVFDRKQNGSAYKRFHNALGCGLNIRNVSTIKDEKVTDTELSKDEVKAMAEINKFIKDKTDEELKEAFGIKTPIEVRKLRDGIPYNSKQEFVINSTDSTVGITGHDLYNNFLQYHKDNIEKAA